MSCHNILQCCLCLNLCYKYTEFSSHCQALFYFFLLSGNNFYFVLFPCVSISVTNISNFHHINKHFFLLLKQFLFCLVSLFRFLVTNIINLVIRSKHFFYIVETLFLFPHSFRIIVSKNFTNIVNFHIRTKHFFYFVGKTECFMYPVLDYCYKKKSN